MKVNSFVLYASLMIASRGASATTSADITSDILPPLMDSSTPSDFNVRSEEHDDTLDLGTCSEAPEHETRAFGRLASKMGGWVSTSGKWVFSNGGQALLTGVAGLALNRYTNFEELVNKGFDKIEEVARDSEIFGGVCQRPTAPDTPDTPTKPTAADKEPVCFMPTYKVTYAEALQASQELAKICKRQSAMYSHLPSPETQRRALRAADDIDTDATTAGADDDTDAEDDVDDEDKDEAETEIDDGEDEDDDEDEAADEDEDDSAAETEQVAMCGPGAYRAKSGGIICVGPFKTPEACAKYAKAVFAAEEKAGSASGSKASVSASGSRAAAAAPSAA